MAVSRRAARASLVTSARACASAPAGHPGHVRRSSPVPLDHLLRRSTDARHHARALRLANKEARATASAVFDEALALELAADGVLPHPVPPIPTRGPQDGDW